MQNRSTTFSHRGGDTVLMERLKEGLEKLGVEVRLDPDTREDPSGYDIVHLFNFALPQMIEIQGRKAAEAGVPFVVSTLYEDVPSFHNQSHEWGRILIEYVQRGQDRKWFAERAGNNKVEASPRFHNDWVAANAAALFTNGLAESHTISRDYGRGARVREVKLGYEISTQGDPETFARQYGVRDFVLCVGRFETRKNQLMLLKALEDTDIPVVLAGGGFSYQPDYDWAVRNFKRKGKTIILEHVSAETLASAYMGCRIHALPSWYELPGLVSLEAAHYGKNVVATLNGTSADYLAEWAFYCDPADWRSVMNAVTAAYYSPARPGISEWVRQYTWTKTAEETCASYREVLGVGKEAGISAAAAEISSVGQYDMNSGAIDFQCFLEQGESAAKRRDFETAKDLLLKAINLNPCSVKALRSLGAVHLAESDPEKARTFFERAVEIDAEDSRSLSGLGMSEMMLKRHDVAYSLFLRSLKSQPDELVPILQLLECSYILNRFDDLEHVLRGFLANNPEENEMKFCLAGCLYKLGRWEEAARYNAEVQAVNPEHRGAGDLARIIENERPKASDTPPPCETFEQPRSVKPQEALSEMLSRLVEKKVGERGGPAAQPVMPPTVSPSSQSVSDCPAPVSSDSLQTGVDASLAEIEEDKRRKNYGPAMEHVEKLLRRPDLSPAQWERASTQRGELEVVFGNLQEAESLYDEVLQKNSASARALAGKGALAAARGDWEGGRRYFEQALASEQGYDVALAGMGLWSQCSGDVEKAWDYYQKALAGNPENTRALLGVIEIGYATGRLQAVEEAVGGYLEMHPGDLDFIYALAGCYFAQNRIDEARSELEKVILFDPHHEKAVELRQLIEAREAGKSLTF